MYRQIHIGRPRERITEPCAGHIRYGYNSSVHLLFFCKQEAQWFIEYIRNAASTATTWYLEVYVNNNVIHSISSKSKLDTNNAESVLHLFLVLGYIMKKRLSSAMDSRQIGQSLLCAAQHRPLRHSSLPLPRIRGNLYTLYVRPSVRLRI